jgi:hypothetical protein
VPPCGGAQCQRAQRSALHYSGGRGRALHLQVAYMAPECFTRDYGISEKTDVYSLAIILWEA